MVDCANVYFGKDVGECWVDIFNVLFYMIFLANMLPEFQHGEEMKILQQRNMWIGSMILLTGKKWMMKM